MMPTYQFDVGDRVVITVDLDRWVKAGTPGEVIDRTSADGANVYRVMCDVILGDPSGQQRRRMVTEDRLQPE